MQKYESFPDFDQFLVLTFAAKQQQHTHNASTIK